MAVAFSSFTGHGDTNPTTACTVTLPTTAADDILILQVINGGANAALTPGGTYNGSAWAAIGTNAGWTSGWGGLWWSRCTGNHATQTVTFTGATDSISAAVTRVTGCITTGNPYDTNISAETEGAGANLSLAAFDTTVADTLVVFSWSIDDNLSPSSVAKNGSAMGNVSIKSSTGGADSQVGNASLAQSGTGTTGAFSATMTAGTNQGKLLKGFALKPPAAAPITLPLVSSDAVSTSALELHAPDHLQLAASGGQSSTALGLSNPTLVALDPVSTTSTTALSLRADDHLQLGSAGAVSTTALTLTVPGPESLPLQAADAVSTASLGLRADDRLQLAPAASTSTTALGVHAPDLLQLAPASTTSTTALDLHAPDLLQLDVAAAAASTTLTLTTPGPVSLDLAPCAAVSSAALALRADDHLQFAGATATATTALVVSTPAPESLPLAPAAAQSATALVLVAPGVGLQWPPDSDAPWAQDSEAAWAGGNGSRWPMTSESRWPSA